MDNEGHSYQWSQLPRRMKPFETTLLKIHVTFNGIYKYFLFQPLPLLYQLCFISVYLSYLLLTSFLLLSFLISSLYFSPLPLERRVGAAGSLRSDGGNYCEWHRRQIRLRGPQEHQWRQWQREVDLAAPPSGEADSWPLAPGVMMAAAANSGDVRVSASSGQGFDFGFFFFFLHADNINTHMKKIVIFATLSGGLAAQPHVKIGFVHLKKIAFQQCVPDEISQGPLSFILLLGHFFLSITQALFSLVGKNFWV